MDKKNMKTLVGIFGGLAVVIACGLGWDAYEKQQYRARSDQARRNRAEMVRNLNEGDIGNAPNVVAIKKALVEAEAALSRKDVDTFKKLYAKYTLLNIKALKNREPEDLREGLHEFCCSLVGKYVELQTSNWDQLSEEQKKDVRMDLVCELDEEVATSYSKGEIK